MTIIPRPVPPERASLTKPKIILQSHYLRASSVFNARIIHEYILIFTPDLVNTSILLLPVMNFITELFVESKGLSVSCERGIFTRHGISYMLLVAVSYYSIVRWNLPWKNLSEFLRNTILGSEWGTEKFPSLKTELRH